MNNDFFIPHTTYLKNIIHSIWQVNGVTPYQNETIIPKGVIEIIFDLGDDVPMQSEINNKEFQLAKCFINGYNTRPIRLRLPLRQFFFGVQFHPVAIKPLFGIQAGELTNLLVDLALLYKSAHSLWQQLIEAKAFHQRVSITCEWIKRKMIQSYPQEFLLDNFLGSNDGHNTDVKALAKALCYSPRHLSRKLLGLTGMNTEQVLLYKKYLHSVHLMHASGLTLTEIAYESGFADQAHFIKSFRAFADLTPNEYRRNRSRIPGHIYQNVR